MKQFVIMLLMVSILLTTSCREAFAAKDMKHFVAVICSYDLRDAWVDYPKFDTDYLIYPNNWDELDAVLDDLGRKVGDQPILLDFMVHGFDDGLYLVNDDEGKYCDRASMGYILNHVQRRLQGKKLMITFEACYAGRAYKGTIRGACKRSVSDNIEDYQGVPNFPVYGTGDAFPTVGQMMYLQLKHNFRKWWVNLVDYDPLGKNRPLAKREEPSELVGKEKFEPSTFDMIKVLAFFRYII